MKGQSNLAEQVTPLETKQDNLAEQVPSLETNRANLTEQVTSLETRVKRLEFASLFTIILMFLLFVFARYGR